MKSLLVYTLLSFAPFCALHGQVKVDFGVGLNLYALFRDNTPAVEVFYLFDDNRISAYAYLRVQKQLANSNWSFAPELYGIQKSNTIYLPNSAETYKGYVSLLNWGLQAPVTYSIPIYKWNMSLGFSAGVFGEACSDGRFGFEDLGSETAHFRRFGERLDGGYVSAFRLQGDTRWDVRFQYFRGFNKYRFTASPSASFEGTWIGAMDALVLTFGLSF